MELKTTKKVTVYLYENSIKEARELCEKLDLELVDFIEEAIDEHIERIKQENIY